MALPKHWGDQILVLSNVLTYQATHKRVKIWELQRGGEAQRRGWLHLRAPHPEVLHLFLHVLPVLFIPIRISSFKSYPLLVTLHQDIMESTHCVEGELCKI